MAKIQILEISPVETPMEDLSYDVVSNITGGGLGDFLKDLVLGALGEAFDFLKTAYTECVKAGGDPVLCLDAIFDEL